MKYTDIVPENEAIIRATYAIYDCEDADDLITEREITCTEESWKLAQLETMRELLREVNVMYHFLDRELLYQLDIYNGESPILLDDLGFISECAIRSVGDLFPGAIIAYRNKIAVVLDLSHFSPNCIGVAEIRSDLTLSTIWELLDSTMEVIHFYDYEW